MKRKIVKRGINCRCDFFRERGKNTPQTHIQKSNNVFYASSVTPHIWPWFPNSCLYLILEVFDIDLCSMECYFPRSRARKVTFHALERGEWLSMLWDLGFCKCQHSQFTYSLLIKRNLTIFERVPLPWPGFEPGISHTEDERLTTWSTQASLKCEVHLVLQIVDAAIASRLQCAHQGYNS